MSQSIKRIAVTGGAGQIAYNLLFRIAYGELLGPGQAIALHILELPESMKFLEGVVMELQDCAFPLLKEIIVGSDPQEVFKDVDYALLLGAKPRGPGMERKDLLGENGKIFTRQGKALNLVASRDVKVLVVGNPCNTNCLIASHHAPEIPKENFMAMTRLDENRARFQLSKKAGVNVDDVKQLVVWGNHSSTQVPDYFHATIHGKSVEKIMDKTWLEQDFMSAVQKRGAAIIEARGKSSAASAAHAVIDTFRSLMTPTPKGEAFSLAVSSNGNSYGIQEGLIFSFPCRSNGDGKYEVIEGWDLNVELKRRIGLSEKELIEERQAIDALLEVPVER